MLFSDQEHGHLSIYLCHFLKPEFVVSVYIIFFISWVSNTSKYFILWCCCQLRLFFLISFQVVGLFVYFVWMGMEMGVERSGLAVSSRSLEPCVCTAGGAYDRLTTRAPGFSREEALTQSQLSTGSVSWRTPEEQDRGSCGHPHSLPQCHAFQWGAENFTATLINCIQSESSLLMAPAWTK